MATPLWKCVIARILEGLLAFVFLAPLIWVIICSFSPQPGSSQVDGWGINNYLTLFKFQEGLSVYLFNSVVVSGVTVVFLSLYALWQAIRSLGLIIQGVILAFW